MFLGCSLERWRREATGRLRIVATCLPVLLILTVGAAAGGWLVRVHRTLPAQEAFRNYEAFADLIRRQAPAPSPIIFFRTEAHALAFHTGKPLQTLSDWTDLEAQLAPDGDHYVVMPPATVAEARHVMTNVYWDTVASNAELAGGAHERPLVLLRAKCR